MLRVMKIFSHHTAASRFANAQRALDPEQRCRELSRLLPLWPLELADVSLAGRRRIVALMERALRAERTRGHAGHWAYDLARHAALHRAWISERAALLVLERGGFLLGASDLPAASRPEAPEHRAGGRLPKGESPAPSKKKRL